MVIGAGALCLKTFLCIKVLNLTYIVLFRLAMPLEPTIDENAANQETVKFQLKVVDPDKVVQRVIQLKKHVPVRDLYSYREQVNALSTMTTMHVYYLSCHQILSLYRTGCIVQNVTQRCLVLIHSLSPVE